MQKLAAAAGRSALLPLHDASNISGDVVENIQQERLLQKLKSGKANENYLKINLKKKVFVRGRAGRMTGAKHRRQEWKKKVDEKKKTEAKKNSKSNSSKSKFEGNKISSNKNLDSDKNKKNIPSNAIVDSKRQNRKTALKVKNLEDQSNLKSNNSNESKTVELSDIVDNCEDTSYTTEEEVEKPKSRKKSQKVAKKSKTSTKKASIKKSSKTTKVNLNQLEAQKVDENVSNAEQDVWGDDLDESLLLDCFDETGKLQPISNSTKENTDQQNTPLPGIGTKVAPYYPSDESYVKEEVLNILRNKFGHKAFRSGQEEAIRRILCGKSTLVQLATGSGKSLVYQLPAYLYAERQHCITVVVSPLVSLMEDQINGLPGFLRGACFHSAQTVRQREKVVEQIKDAASGNNQTLRIHFLLVSPETLAGGGSLFASVLRYLPPIAFVCIDEAHCVSAWSHNFRPTYLRLCRVINERLGVETILGLTASAPESTIKDVAQRLSVCLKDGIIRGKLLPPNLKLSVSRGESRGRGKEGDLIALLGSKPFNDFGSIIVYCTRRDTCEKLATIIRTQFQDRDIKLNKVSSRSVVSQPKQREKRV